MFDLEGAVAQWRERLAWRKAFDAADIEEMEAHLRDEIQALVDEGHSGQKAFFSASGGFGEEEELSRNFDRAHWEATLTIALLSVGYSTFRAASASPVDALRTD